jgi:hypothetical protein
MLTLTEILLIIFIHWIADFICQDEKWALGKSKNWNDLLSHTAVYSIIWMILGSILKATNIVDWNPGALSLFVLITFIAHTITDYFTSRIVSKKFATNHYGSPIPNFGAFTIIGFDQVLHYVQLFLTYYLLTKN